MEIKNDPSSDVKKKQTYKSEQACVNICLQTIFFLPNLKRY